MTGVSALFMTTIMFATISSCGGGATLVDMKETGARLTEARQLYAQVPRTEERVSRAWQLASDALNNLDGADTSHYADLVDCTRYTLWLALNSIKKASRSRFASEAQRLASGLIHKRKNMVEGYYYRAIAVGTFADLNRSTGRQAMRNVRNDALTAIELDERFDFGGPHRLLGALYLRAPAPPAGIGSVRRALQHLEKAWQIAPDHPENLNFLAEIYLRLGRKQQALQLVEKALATEGPDSGLVTAENRRTESETLRRKIVELK